MNYGILYSGFLTILEGHNNANWITNSNETKFTNSYVFTLGGGTITWKSGRQTIIDRSTRELEFVTSELTSSKVDWLRNLLSNIPFVRPRNFTCLYNFI